LLDFIKQKYDGYKIFLWTLEENNKARAFYEINDFRVTGRHREIERGDKFLQIEYIY